MKPIIVEVAGAVIRREERILICQRRSLEGRPGLWEFPGGKCEPGESLAECLIREVREEVGCEVSVGELLDRVEVRKSGRTLYLNFYETTLLSGEPVPIECDQVAWVAPGELDSYQFLPPNLDLLSRLKASGR